MFIYVGRVVREYEVYADRERIEMRRDQNLTGQDREAEKRATDAAKNSLEAFIYSTKVLSPPTPRALSLSLSYLSLYLSISWSLPIYLFASYARTCSLLHPLNLVG